MCCSDDPTFINQWSSTLMNLPSIWHTEWNKPRVLSGNHLLMIDKFDFIIKKCFLTKKIFSLESNFDWINDITWWRCFGCSKTYNSDLKITIWLFSLIDWSPWKNNQSIWWTIMVKFDIKHYMTSLGRPGYYFVLNVNSLGLEFESHWLPDILEAVCNLY